MSHVSAQLPAPRHHTSHGSWAQHATAPATPHDIEQLDPLELRFCHLQSPRDVARVMHLRQEIHLPTSTLADPGFASREKKETRLDLSALSSGADNSSGRSGSFRSAWGWRHVKASSSACPSCRPMCTHTAGKWAASSWRLNTAPSRKS